MSEYSVELRKIVAWPGLLEVLSGYPIYDEEHRSKLNELFLQRYYFRDIGYETAEMFFQRLHFKLLEIMPMYNQLYETATATYAEFDPLVTVDLTNTAHGTVAGTTTDESTTTGTSTATSHSESVSDQYDMPQTQLDQTGDYLTSRGTSSADGTNSGTSGSTDNRTGGSTGTSDMLTDTKGLSGASKAQLLMEYRSAILNIDAMIVDELGILFMQVWRPVARNH